MAIDFKLAHLHMSNNIHIRGPTTHLGPNKVLVREWEMCSSKGIALESMPEELGCRTHPELRRKRMRHPLHKTHCFANFSKN